MWLIGSFDLKLIISWNPIAFQLSVYLLKVKSSVYNKIVVMCFYWLKLMWHSVKKLFLSLSGKSLDPNQQKDFWAKPLCFHETSLFFRCHESQKTQKTPARLHLNSKHLFLLCFAFLNLNSGSGSRTQLVKCLSYNMTTGTGFLATAWNARYDMLMISEAEWAKGGRREQTQA